MALIASDIPVTLEKPDGRKFSGVKANVEPYPNVIIVLDPTLPLEQGDLITRRLPSGIEEFFEVRDRRFFDVPGMEPHFRADVRRVQGRASAATAPGWDVFISHASEDKEDFVRPLSKGLTARGLRVWLDEVNLTVGDSLNRNIEAALSQSRFGVVVISPSFLRKEWPRKELDGLTAREHAGGKIILPVWHGVKFEDVQRFSPMLADRLAVNSNRGVDHVVDELLRAVEASAPNPRPQPDGTASAAPRG